MRLLYKFFLAFFLTNLTLVGLMLLLVRLNLSSGFDDFVRGVENEHVKTTRQKLIVLYQESYSWKPIVENEQVWRDLVDPEAKKSPPPPPKPGQRGHDERPPAYHPPPVMETGHGDFLKTGRRLSLYDQNKQVIVGKNKLEDNPRTEKIMLDGNLIGWLGFEPSKSFQNSPGNQFLAQQYRVFYLIAIAVIIIAIAMALLLSQHLLAPIKRIVSGTNELIAGNYRNRIVKSTRDELGALANNVNDLAHTLEQNQQLRAQWMSDTSHELRTPLTVLRSHLIAIQDGVFDVDEKRVQLFIDEIDNLSHIVDDLYQLSNSDAGCLTYKKSKLNPAQLFLEVCKSFTARFQQNSLTVDTESLLQMASNHSITLSGDKERLRQLFTNLLENSCRYTHENGSVNITAKLDTQQLIMCVDDSPPGVTEVEQPKLFKRFYRVEQSRNRSHGGAGLGLALCKQIVEAHQGSIQAMNSPLGGLRIKMTFPI